MMAKWVYRFGGGSAEGRADMRNLLGGKGANLAEMSALGLPVPPGFTITTEVCTYFYANAKSYPPELKADVESALRQIEEIVGAKFGDPKKPLLVSVRSGARVSTGVLVDVAAHVSATVCLDPYRAPVTLGFGPTSTTRRGHATAPPVPTARR